MSNRLLRLFSIGSLSLVLLFGLSASTALAQSTAFTYQGKLADSGNPANGSYDFQVKLFDAVSAGTQQGSTITVSNVTVTNGSFTVQLDFGACDSCFNGAARFLEIAVKKTTDPSFTLLSPRQPINSTPHAIKTLNLTFNGPYSDGGFAGSAAANTFAGNGAGLNTTPGSAIADATGKLNSFFGSNAGQANTIGLLNSFFGSSAGTSNTTGIHNAFFGAHAGHANVNGYYNAFFGAFAGQNNCCGDYNSFFGYMAGFNTSGTSENAFFGNAAGQNNTVGRSNTAIGSHSDIGTTLNDNFMNATAIGARALVTQSNSLVLGAINGVNNCTPANNCDNVSVGIGTTAPAARLHVVGTTALVGSVGVGTTTPAAKLEVVGDWNGQHGALTLRGDKPTIRFSGGAVAGNQQWMLHLGSDGPGSLEFFNGGTTGTWGPVLTMTPAGAVGIGTTTPTDALQVVGNLRVGFGTNGCVKDADGTVIAGTCSSDVRLKRDILPFAHLLDKLAQLQPVTFYWRSHEFKERHFGSRQSYGLIAQEVEKVLPELVSTDEQGYKAVNYSKLPLLSIQAIKELKAENDALKEQIKEQQVQAERQQQRLQQQLTEQQQQMAAMKQSLCQMQPHAKFCNAKPQK